MNLSECQLQREGRFATSYSSQPMPLPLLVLFTAAASVIILLTIFGNLLVLCFKARVGRTNTTLLVWNLGLTDFLVGMFVLPLGAFHIIAREWRFGRFLCRLWVAADVTFCTCSVVTICVISVDRYLAVTRPLRYKSVVTKTKVIIAMMIIWSFSTSILLTTVRWDQPDCLDTVCEFPHQYHKPIFSFPFKPHTLTLYWRIYRLARKRQRALDRGFLMILGQNMNFLTNTISQQMPRNGTSRGDKGYFIAQFMVCSKTEREDYSKIYAISELIQQRQQQLLLSVQMYSHSGNRYRLMAWQVFTYFHYCTHSQWNLHQLETFHGDLWRSGLSFIYPSSLSALSSPPPPHSESKSSDDSDKNALSILIRRYCNSMLNPIIYSFTVREFKRSTIRLVLPMWRLFHRILPMLVPAPPEHIVSRVSRSGARGKPRRRSFDLTSNRQGLVTSQMAIAKRRQTVPAVLTIDEQPVLNDITRSELLEGYNAKRHENRRRAVRKHTIIKKGLNSERNDTQPSQLNETHITLATNGTKTINLNGLCDTLPMNTVRVYCLTSEVCL
uniref:G_PROTEIN_RECEP_F1_2 domain-containing protein n=1 Tax=Ascaris lumbricoides TaxID=6252 RepID=A0A0M3HQT2_ASCLU